MKFETLSQGVPKSLDFFIMLNPFHNQEFLEIIEEFNFTLCYLRILLFSNMMHFSNFFNFKTIKSMY
jgi:hypothetical protein